MAGEKQLSQLLKGMRPFLNPGQFIFCSVENPTDVQLKKALGLFKEAEGTTLILEKQIADQMGISYDFVSAWITLSIHSALDAVGLTAAFAAALTQADISCNVVAGYYHDHIFVAEQDAQKAIEVLEALAQNGGAGA